MKVIKIFVLMMVFAGILSDNNKIVKKVLSASFDKVDAVAERAGGNSRMGGGTGG